MNGDPRRSRARAERNAKYAAAVLSAPAASPLPLPREHRTPGQNCPTSGSAGERFAPDVHHCTNLACEAFWSPA